MNAHVCQTCFHDLTEHRMNACFAIHPNGEFCWCHEDKERA